jgi:hypothetical protein
MDFMAGPCTLSLNCKVPPHELRKKCPGCQEFIHALCGRVLSADEGAFKEDDVVCLKCDNSKKPARKPLPNTTPGFQPPLFQYGFRRLTKKEVEQKNADRAALFDAVAVKQKQDALREAAKIKAEEAAAAKADAEKYLNMKRQKRFRDRERMKKAQARTVEKEEQSEPLSSLPIALPSKKTKLV